MSKALLKSPALTAHLHSSTPSEYQLKTKVRQLSCT